MHRIVRIWALQSTLCVLGTCTQTAADQYRHTSTQLESEGQILWIREAVQYECDSVSTTSCTFTPENAQDNYASQKITQDTILSLRPGTIQCSSAIPPNRPIRGGRDLGNSRRCLDHTASRSNPAATRPLGEEERPSQSCPDLVPDHNRSGTS